MKTLFGPFPLSAERIGNRLQASSPGVFALGDERDGMFVIQQVGRSDDDVRSALMAHVGRRFTLFKFGYAPSAVDAFEKECELYHSLATLDNPIHPTAPDGTYPRCSRCQYLYRAVSA